MTSAAPARRLSAAGFLATLALGLAILFGAPHALDTFGLVQCTGFAALAMFGLSQGFVWGFAGVMCFGQAAFLGLGGYAYAVVFKACSTKHSGGAVSGKARVQSWWHGAISELDAAVVDCSSSSSLRPVGGSTNSVARTRTRSEERSVANGEPR